MNNLFSRLITLLLLVLLVAIAPYIITTTVSDYMGRIEILRDMSNFVDQIADNRVLTAQQLEDFNLNISSHGLIVTSYIEHYKLVTNPNPGGTNGEITYTLVKQAGEVGQDSVFTKGDYIVVTVKSIGYSGAQRIVMGLLKAFYPSFECRLPCRVR